MAEAVKIKICGITNLEDAQAAVDAGADYLGFILYTKSPRYIAPARLRILIADLRAWLPVRLHVGLVGVFVNEDPRTVRDILEMSGLDFAQLHGDEPPAHLQELAGRAYKALRPASGAAAQAEAARYWPLVQLQTRHSVSDDREVTHTEKPSVSLDSGPARPEMPRLLVDAYAPAAYGGTGQRADWNAAAELARRYAGLLLAGGLTPENVPAAIEAVQPWGVDVSSGVESEPGRKDHARLRQFVRAALFVA